MKNPRYVSPVDPNEGLTEFFTVVCSDGLFRSGKFSTYGFAADLAMNLGKHAYPLGHCYWIENEKCIRMSNFLFVGAVLVSQVAA